jgi:hypothetical protein
VGYFSRISNWNKSKLGELKDRHRGDYAVTSLFPPAQQSAEAQPRRAGAEAAAPSAELGTAAG